MQEQNKNKQAVWREFFWKIPGDVPGYRDREDPFQSKRSLPDPDFQHLAHIETSKQTLTPATSTVKSAAVASASDSAQKHVHKSISIRNLAVFVLVLFMPGLGVVGYSHYVTPPEINLNPTSDKLNPVVVVETNAINEPRVFELTLGRQLQSPQQTLRVVTHVVVKGDTLWDIAELYVKDPFRYPELAELSDIKTPDLIYPYDLVRIHIYE